MGSYRTFALLGGDERQRSAAEHLRALGYCVRTWGLSPQDDTDWRTVLPAEVVLLPLPATTDGVSVAAPLVPDAPRLSVSELSANLPHGTVLLGGRLPPEWVHLAGEAGLTVFDYASDDVFQMKNALPTAEGAILLALRELRHTLSGSAVAVTGYGRIASLLADRLRALGAAATVCARRARDLAAAAMRGHAVSRLVPGCPPQLPSGCRAVFNTVPAQLFDRSAAAAFPQDCLYIELASAPGGMDPTIAQACGVRYLPGGGLPGRCFPETAGIIVAETALSLLPDNNRKDTPLC